MLVPDIATLVTTAKLMAAALYVIAKVSFSSSRGRPSIPMDSTTGGEVLVLTCYFSI